MTTLAQHLLTQQASTYEEHLDTLAAQIWRSIVGESLPVIPHYNHWVISRPAKHVGGDFHLASEDCVFVGDVSGKGIPAALKLAAHMRDPGRAIERALYDELERWLWSNRDRSYFQCSSPR